MTTARLPSAPHLPHVPHARDSHAHASGWTRAQVGMLCLILAEVSFFGIFVVAYLFYIGKSASGPQPEQVLRFPLAATIALLSSSLTVVVATRSLVAGQSGRFLAALAATIALGATFVVATALEWRELIELHGLTIRTNLFGTTYYSLVGFHAAHVIVGLSMLSLILVLGGLGRVRAHHAEKVEMVSWYWHFVDVVWIVVLTVVYVIGLQT
jgi:cytochrome c oxidase subunit 3